MLNRFAIVCEWPNLRTSENETIYRIQIAAKKIGKECVIINSSGKVIPEFTLENSLPMGVNIKNSDIDFIINLHFSGAKNYDGFSYVALWNPLQFYVEWGYENTSSNLVSHHDSITCISKQVEWHFERTVLTHNTYHLNPYFILNHTNSEEMHDFNETRKHIFYCGINWKSSDSNARGLDVLKPLDKMNLIKTYGPKKIPGIKKSYMGEIPFDGKSFASIIANYRMAICFSHNDHINSHITSTRIFEALAGGAMPLCDYNPFIIEHFGENVLYIDRTLPEKEVLSKILESYYWIEKNPIETAQKVRKAQEIMKAKFSLKNQLDTLYRGHQERRKLVEEKYISNLHEQEINVFYFCYSKDDNFAKLNTSLETQIYKNFKLFIVYSQDCLPQFCSNIKYEYKFIPYSKELMKKENFGKLFYSLFKDVISTFLPDALILLATENDNMFFDHLASLKRKIDEGNNIVASSTTLNFAPPGKPYSYLKINKITITQSNTPISTSILLFKQKILSSQLLEKFLYEIGLEYFTKALIIISHQEMGFTNFPTVSSYLPSCPILSINEKNDSLIQELIRYYKLEIHAKPLQFPKVLLTLIKLTEKIQLIIYFLRNSTRKVRKLWKF